MKRTAWVITLAIVIFLVAIVSGVYALFHGEFDRGNFQVERSTLSPSGQLAIVAKRSDHQALSGDQYFVVLGDHLPSPADLKHAYYHDGVVFRAGNDCLAVRWKTVRELVVTCKDNSIAADQIAVERRQTGDITVDYENIPAMARN